MISKHFTEKLIKWHLRKNKRVMPWKGEKDPYKIWISEIILQQTRVEQGLEYYNKFILRFPTIDLLATAPEEEIFKLWEGLGYYSRCKNLIYTAKNIFFDLQGNFPATFEEILKLKGVGPYTAAAIASFAFGLPHAVVDGNVTRVLSRYFGDSIPIDSAKGKNHFTQLANQLLHKKDPGQFNQAIMDFGATICKPQNPLCSDCVMIDQCVGYQSNIVELLPVKEKKLIKKKRWLSYFVFKLNKAVFIKKRTEKDIWQNLHEFFLIESKKHIEWDNQSINEYLNSKLNINDFEILSVSDTAVQQLTHQTLEGKFITIKIKKASKCLDKYMLFDFEQLDKIAFPRFITSYLETNELEKLMR